MNIKEFFTQPRFLHPLLSGMIMLVTLLSVVNVSVAEQPIPKPTTPAEIKDIKSYCLDFNWGGRRSFVAPGTWAGADPAAHVAWYKAMTETSRCWRVLTMGFPSMPYGRMASLWSRLSEKKRKVDGVKS